jgi:hypothetical protein
MRHTCMHTRCAAAQVTPVRRHPLRSAANALTPAWLAACCQPSCAAAQAGTCCRRRPPTPACCCWQGLVRPPPPLTTNFTLSPPALGAQAPQPPLPLSHVHMPAPTPSPAVLAASRALLQPHSRTIWCLSAGLQVHGSVRSKLANSSDEHTPHMH